MQPDLTDAEIERVRNLLLQVDSDPIGAGLARNWHRNPDGPEAASLITALRERVRELESGLEPFAAASRKIEDGQQIWVERPYDKEITVDHFRHARHLLTGGRDE